MSTLKRDFVVVEVAGEEGGGNTLVQVDEGGWNRFENATIASRAEGSPSIPSIRFKDVLSVSFWVE